MITDYDYITLNDPNGPWWIIWIPISVMIVSALITVLYLIFARKRTFDGILIRFAAPLGLSMFALAIIASVVDKVEDDNLKAQAQHELSELFVDVDNLSLLKQEFLAETEEGTIVRGALISANPNGEYKRYAVVYIPVKHPGEK